MCRKFWWGKIEWVFYAFSRINFDWFSKFVNLLLIFYYVNAKTILPYWKKMFKSEKIVSKPVKYQNCVLKSRKTFFFEFQLFHDLIERISFQSFTTAMNRRKQNPTTRKECVNICTTTYRNYICDSRRCHNSAVTICYECYSSSGGWLCLVGNFYWTSSIFHRH